jgi:hypothetical protein
MEMQDPLDMPPSDQLRPKPRTNNIYAWNLAILATYMVILNFPKDNLGAKLGQMFLIAMQVFINLVAGISCLVVERRKPFAQAFFLSALLVLLIGFGLCVVI